MVLAGLFLGTVLHRGSCWSWREYVVFCHCTRTYLRIRLTHTKSVHVAQLAAVVGSLAATPMCIQSPLAEMHASTNCTRAYVVR